MKMRTKRIPRRGRGLHLLALAAVGVFGIALAVVAASAAGGTTPSFATEEGVVAYAGDDECAVCHADVVESFASAIHGRARAAAWSGANRCESCHGAGAAHVESGGTEAIFNPASASTDAGARSCTGCHGGQVAAHWDSGAHAANDVSCSDCHGIHVEWKAEQIPSNQATTESCLSCHRDMRKHLYQRSGHPLRDGQMTCTSCHDPHGSPAEGSIAAITANDKCYECHADKRGPYLYEHAPVREDCMTCHDAHGSNQTMMLVASAPRLCQSCHLFGHHQTVPGLSRQVWNQNRSCLNCHPRIHGSNHPSGVIFMR